MDQPTDRPTKWLLELCVRLLLLVLNRLIPIMTMVSKFLARSWRHFRHVRQKRRGGWGRGEEEGGEGENFPVGKHR